MESKLKSQWEPKVKTSNLPKLQENAGDQVVIGVSFAFDWLREWCEFSGPIIEWSKPKPMQTCFTFHTQWNIALNTLKS